GVADALTGGGFENFALDADHGVAGAIVPAGADAVQHAAAAAVGNMVVAGDRLDMAAAEGRAIVLREGRAGGECGGAREGRKDDLTHYIISLKCPGGRGRFWSKRHEPAGDCRSVLAAQDTGGP